MAAECIGSGSSFGIRRREAWRVFLLYAALTVAFTWPLALDPAGTLMPMGPDGNLFMWTLAWDVHAFIRQPLALFDANIYYPFHNTLAYSENLIGSALVAAPVLWTTGNAVLAINVVQLLSVVLCAFGAYVLARRMGLSPLAAGIAGLVFGFSPPRFFRTGQLHLGPVQWIPFGLACLHAYLKEGKKRDLHLACLVFTVQALTSGHGAAFIFLAYALLIGHHLLVGGAVEPIQRLRDLGVRGMLLLAPAALLYLPYRRAQVEMGLRRTLENWVVTPESYIASPTHLHQWLLQRMSSAPVLETASAFLFPGYLPLVLAVVALLWQARWSTARRGSMVIFAATLALVGLWLSLGPPLGIWPLVYNWPGLSFVRVPSRFLTLGVLGLALLAGFGAERMFARLGPRRGGIAAVVLGLCLAAEFAAFPLQVVPATSEPPRADRWLATLPGPVVVAEVPLPDPRHAGAFERRQTEFMLHSTAHWHKTIHGYSGIRPPFHDALYARLRTFPTESCLTRLAEIGVTHVVVHADLYQPGEWQSVQEQIQAQRDRLALRYVAGTGRVYEVLRQ